MKKQTKSSAAKPVLIFNWTDEWPIAHNALFTDGAGNFWLGDSTKRPEKKVTIAEALRWYAETCKYGSGDSGCIATLCSVAARNLEDLQTWEGASLTYLAQQERTVTQGN